MAVKLKPKTMPDFFHNQRSIQYQTPDNLDSYDSLAAIYLLRLAIGLQKQLSAHDLNSLFTDELAKLTGLTVPTAKLLPNNESKKTTGANQASAESPDNNKNALVKLIRSRLKNLLKKGMSVNSPLFANISELAKNFDLNAIDQEILVLKALMYIPTNL